MNENGFVRMEQLWELMLHADQHIVEIVTRYGTWTYAILAAIIFVETGLVVVAFFPGDGTLFAAGMLAATGHLDLSALFVLLTAATVLGHTSNHLIGRYFGGVLFRSAASRRRWHFDRAVRFFARYGFWAVVFSRFFPFLRSMVPFVSGVAHMPFGKFSLANVLGGMAWIATYLLAGYVLGEIPVVQQHFGLVFGLMLAVLTVGLFVGLVKQIAAHRRDSEGTK